MVVVCAVKSTNGFSVMHMVCRAMDELKVSILLRGSATYYLVNSWFYVFVVVGKFQGRNGIQYLDVLEFFKLLSNGKS